MNREQRRAANKILKLDAGRDFGEDACVLCAFLNVQVVGGHQQQYKDPKGKLIELTVAHRIEPPNGFRWPRLLEERPLCNQCNGQGQVSNSFIKNGEIVRQRNLCQPCKGTGKQLKGDEFAQLCEQCSHYLMAWLQARAQAHMNKHYTAGGRLVTATPGQLTQMLAERGQATVSPGLGKVFLPGIER